MNMHDCEWVRGKIAPYLEGLLEDQEAKLVQAHLAVCLECQRLYSALQQVPEMLKDWQPDPPSELMWEQIMMVLAPQHACNQSRRIRQRKRWLWGGALAAVATLLLLFIAIRMTSFPTYPDPVSLDYRLGLNPEVYAAADKVVRNEANTCHIPHPALIKQFTEEEKKDFAHFQPPDGYIVRYMGKTPCPSGSAHSALVVLYGEERTFTMFLLPEESPESHKVPADGKCYVKEMKDHLMLAYRHPCGRTVVILGKISARDAARMAVGRNP